MIDEDKIQWLQDNYTFFSCVKYGNKKEYKEYLGIIINSDSTITSMYDFEQIDNAEARKHFIELGEQWWWESNRLIPINLFLRSQIEPFNKVILNMNTKDTEVLWGPETSLSNIIQKRIKRRSVQLVRKID